MNKTRVALIALGATTIALGLTISNSLGHAPRPAPSSAQAVPTATVTATATATATATVTPKQTLPPSCREALAAADKLAGISADVAHLVSAHLGSDQTLFTSLASGDASGMDAYISDMTDFTDGITGKADEVEKTGYPALRDACLAHS